MSSHGVKYAHLVGKHVDEATQVLRGDGLEPRVYHYMGLIQSKDPKMVQLQVDPQTKKVQSIS